MKVCEDIEKKIPAKRVSIVSIKMVCESSILYAGRRINSPSEGAELARGFLENCDREELILICLNNKNEPISVSTISIGSLNASIVHPREVFKVAILSNSASVILAHNHPSGDTTPSSEDVSITKRLVEAGKIIGIPIIDHIVIGKEFSYCSLKEKGML
ncbi:JAB domain-containing protein [Clostridium sp. DSM 17811]|nr:JAB domain-containing protein [Clostridium sp. DSM 17811]MBU3097674.1 JAB domain-containing protein [Clostridium sp. DSM 17811]